jgi:hypothetical protein
LRSLELTDSTLGLIAAAVLGRSSSLAKGAIIGIVVGAVVVVLVLAALTIYVVMLRHRAKKLEEMSKPFGN